MKTKPIKHPCFIAGLLIAVVLASFAAGVAAQDAAARRGQAVVWRWPDAMDSVNAAPKNHAVLFENDHVRLLEVTVQPGETEAMHGHKFPSIFMMDAPQPKVANRNLEEDAGEGNRPRPAHPPQEGEALYPTCRAMTTPQAPHQVTNTESFPQHFYRMEFKKIDGEAIRKMTHYPAQ